MTGLISLETWTCGAKSRDVVLAGQNQHVCENSLNQQDTQSQHHRRPFFLKNMLTVARPATIVGSR